MSDETALLRAIAAHPDEDTPRLAYADWLDEHKPAKAKGRGKKKSGEGNRRAALIRAQRCRQLLDEHEEGWLKQDVFVLDWSWSRGFVEAFSAEPVDLVEDGEELFGKYPFRRLWLWKLNGDAEGVDCIPAGNHLTALDLTGNGLNTNQLKRLAKMKHLPHLRELGLMFNNLRDTAVKVLCGEEFFQRLDLLRLGANPFTNRCRDQLRKRFGDRVTFAYEREPEWLYTLRDERLRVGWGNDFTQFYMRAGETEQRIAVFDHAGNLLRTETREVDQRAAAGSGAQERNREAARDGWLKELGYRSATIKVKRFQFEDGLGIHPFNWWAEAFDGRQQETRADVEESVMRWLEWGQYKFGYPDEGGDVWFDRTGEVTDT
jgi:uncharacterized protein (TIGR02996 family)